LNSDFQELIPLYRSFPFDVQRWDFVRYLILYRFGGLYADMDYECIEPLDPLLWNSSCCMGMEPAEHAIRNKKPFIIGNALMASVPEHDFLDHIIKDISAVGLQDYKHKGTQVIETTGPFMLNRVYDTYEKKDDITLLPAELVAPLSLEDVQSLIAGVETVKMENKVEKAFAIHYFMGSWVSQTKIIDDFNL
jgi:mannosyltransferase OCH1-like enzyme